MKKKTVKEMICVCHKPKDPLLEYLTNIYIMFIELFKTK